MVPRDLVPVQPEPEYSESDFIADLAAVKSVPAMVNEPFLPWLFRMDPPDVPVHPVADMFPMMTGSPALELVRSIAQHGLDSPIVLDAEGRILDGRNRYAACRMAGVEPEFVAYDGDDPEAFALRANIARRHLDIGQQAMAAVEAADFLKKSGKDVAEAVGVSAAMVSKARRVAEFEPGLVDEIREGRITLTKAYELVTKRPRVRSDVAENTRRNDSERVVRRVRDLYDLLTTGHCPDEPGSRVVSAWDAGDIFDSITVRDEYLGVMLTLGHLLLGPAEEAWGNAKRDLDLVLLGPRPSSLVEITGEGGGKG